MTTIIYQLTEAHPQLFHLLHTYAPSLHDFLMAWYPNL